MQARAIAREDLSMKITVIFFAVFLTLTTFAWRVAAGGPLKEGPQPNDESDAEWMRTIDWFQYARHAIRRKLGADGRSKMRN